MIITRRWNCSWLGLKLEKMLNQKWCDFCMASMMIFQALLRYFPITICKIFWIRLDALRERFNKRVVVVLMDVVLLAPWRQSGASNFGSQSQGAATKPPPSTASSLVTHKQHPKSAANTTHLLLRLLHPPPHAVVALFVTNAKVVGILLPIVLAGEP